MKKLLALLLVLGMASMANAAVSLSVSTDGVDYVGAIDSQIELEPTDTIWIGVHDDGDIGGHDNFVKILSGDGSWTGAGQVYMPPALTSAYIFDYTAEGYGWMFINSIASSTIGPGAGTGAAFEFHCDAQPGDVIIQLQDGGQNPIQDLVIHQIPEPLTLSLLGLGGLGLLRRRR